MTRVQRWVGLGMAAAVVGAFIVPPPASAETIRDHEWWLGPLKISQVHAVSRGDGVIVGMVDTPVDASHPDLTGRVLPGHGYTASDPANGQAGGETARHGTGMAGVIVGEDNAPGGYIGIAPGAKILPYGTYDKGSDYVDAGLRWLTDNGAKVINLSLGGSARPSPEDLAAVKYAIDHDVVVVASAGNVSEAGTPVAAPANIPGVVAVSGVDSTGDAWAGSSRGPEVVIAAPATKIAHPEPRDFSPAGYGWSDGTSPAAAIVSGVAALIRSKYPQLNAASVIERLIRTAKDNGAPGRDKYFGFGTVRPLDALTADVAPVTKSALGEPSAGGTGTSAAPTSGGSTTGGSSFLVPALVIGGGLLFVVVIIVLVVVLSLRRKPPRPVAPPGWQPPHVPQQTQPPQHQHQPPGNN